MYQINGSDIFLEALALLVTQISKHHQQGVVIFFKKSQATTSVYSSHQSDLKKTRHAETT